MATLKVTKGTGNDTVVLEYEDELEKVQETMLNVIELRQRIRVPFRVQSSQSSKPVPLTPISEVKEKLPTKEEVVNYLSTKPDFEHNNADLQQKFLGRRINSKRDQKLYLTFYEIVKRAKKQIVKEYGGEWKVTGHIDFGVYTRISIFKLVKSDVPLIQGTLLQEDLSPPKLISLAKSKEVTT